MTPFLKPEWLEIHQALHNPTVKSWKGKPIIVAPNGCRSLWYLDEGEYVNFMVQNLNKSSRFAEMARQGQNITWGIRKQKPWIYINQPVTQKHLV